MKDRRPRVPEVPDRRPRAPEVPGRRRLRIPLDLRLAALLLVLAVPTGCGPSPARPPAAGGLLVVTSLYPLHDLARRLGEPSDRFVLLTPPGVEPHDWEPSPQQVALMHRADVLLTGGLEPWLPRTRPTLPPRVRHLDARDLLADRGTPPYPSPPTAASGSPSPPAADPHWWLDPLSARVVTAAVADALAAARPDAAAAYRQRAAVLDRRLRRLHDGFREGLARCRRRVLVTSHAAFGHLAARYGLRQVPVAGLTPAEEPGPRRLAEIAALMAREGVDAIFVEPIAPAAAARALARETGASLVPLHPLEGLTPAEARAGADYFSVMEENLRRLRSALDCR